jgi:hypothetical protein
MTTTYVFPVGTMIVAQPATAQPATAPIDTRLAELLDWRRETGRELPLPADLILWLEDRGWVVDLLTGCTSRLEPLQQLIDEAAQDEPPTRDERAGEAAAQFDFERYYRWCQAEAADLRDGMDEADWIRKGC